MTQIMCSLSLSLHTIILYCQLESLFKPYFSANLHAAVPQFHTEISMSFSFFHKSNIYIITAGMHN